MSEARCEDALRRRLRWQCRRGMRELDILLLRFLERGYDRLSEREKRVFESLLGEADQILIGWLLGSTTPVDRDILHVVEKVRRATAP